MGKWNTKQVIPAELTQAEWQAIHTLAVSLRAESLPDDLSPTLDEVIQSWSIHPPVVTERAWVVWDAEASKETPRAVGYNRTTIIHMEENAHLAQVLPGCAPDRSPAGLGAPAVVLQCSICSGDGTASDHRRIELQLSGRWGIRAGCWCGEGLIHGCGTARSAGC